MPTSLAQPASVIPRAPDGATRPEFTDEEIKLIREGADGLMGTMPARFYYDEALYQWEVEHILKRRWLYVGAWDWAEKPGDYFTLTMFGEPLVITRDEKGQLHALVNVCRHRWSQVVPDGRGNKHVLVCPYHRWSYNLDGSLRGVSVEDIPGLQRSRCALPQVRVEEWNGLVFINFDPDATPLAEELRDLDEIIRPYGLATFRSAGITTYESDWNYKFSFETGYEAYHHAGIHAERILESMPPASHAPMAFGKTWGIYAYTAPPEMMIPEFIHPYGPPPWMSDEQLASPERAAIFVGIYPNFISFLQPHQISTITTQHVSAARNISSTTIAMADWALRRPGAAEQVAGDIQFMKDVQDEDTFACRALQHGVRSSFNDRAILHPRFEGQMTHYFNWFLDQFLGAA